MPYTSETASSREDAVEQPNPAESRRANGPSYEEVAHEGVVHWKSTGRYGVVSSGRLVTCVLSSKLHKQLVFPIADPTSFRRRVMEVREIGEADPIAVGDRVQFVPDHAGGMITAVLPRSTTLVRRAAGPKPLAQVIAANVHQVVPIMAAARPAPNWEVLDRYLSAACAQHIPALIVINKVDLPDAGKIDTEVQTYRRAGYSVLLTSALSGAGLDELRSALEGRLSVLFGLSGVGKTSLLNALQPGLGLRVGEVSRAVNKGRHTTTQLEMFALDGGGHLIDTPGMREFGLWAEQDFDLAETFPEMRPYLGHCRFGAGCTHVHEPDCAVKEAVSRGAIAPRRYKSYLKMR